MSTIKITELTNIGANIAYTSLVPVVNMSGTPETQKANLQIVGNLILSGAGGSYFAAAAQANIAQTVSNAAQPNITSVGTLTSVTVSGNANVGNIGGTQGVFTSVSGSLVTASQPNVTSLGTLNALNVNGVANLGQVANVRILGGTSGQILSTDGTGNLSWTNDTTTYGNSNVGAYLANYTGNIAQVNVGTSANLGTVANVKILGGTSGQILSTDGAGNLSWTNDTTTYGNSNVGAYLANYTGNIGNLGFSQSSQSVILGSGVSYVRLDSGNTRIADDSSNVEVWSSGNIFRFTTTGNFVAPTNITGNTITGTLTTAAQPNITSLGNLTGLVMAGNITPSANVTYNLGNNTNRWNNLYLSGNTIVLGDAILTANANALVVTTPDGGNFVLEGNTNTTFGNIAGINIDGNASNILYGNGVFAALSGVSFPIGNGSSNINIATANGNVTITSNGSSTWTFGNDGLLTLPSGNTKIGLQYGSEAILASNASFGVATQGNATTFINWSDDVSNTAMLAAIYVNDPSGNAGNISVRTGGIGNANVWKFVTNGSVIFPTLTVDLHNGGNQQAQTLQFGDPSQQAIITGPTPAANVNAQRLIIQGQRGNGTGEGGDVYFWAGDADTNGGDIKIYAGDADSGTGTGGYINIDAGNGPDGGGQLSLSGGYSSNGQGGQISITPGASANANGAPLNLNGGIGSSDGGNIVITAGYGQANGGQVNITGGISALGLANYGNVVINSGASTWTFDNAGNLVLAGGNSVIQSIANSSLDPTLPNVSTMTLTPDANYTSQVLVLDPTAPGHIHLRAYASSNIDEPSANIFLGGENTSFEVTSGANNDARIHSGGNTWNFDNTGNMTLPGNTLAINFANGTTAFGNIVSTNKDGNASNVLYGNGVFAAAPSGSSYGDSNVVTLLGSFGSNSISTTGNVSANNFTGNTNGFTIGYLDIPQIAASNATLSLTDAGKHYYSTTAGNLTLTIPNNATTSFATGSAVSIVVQAAGNVLVNAASGVTLYMAGSSSAGNRIVGTYGMATLLKVATDTWFINGTGVS